MRVALSTLLFVSASAAPNIVWIMSDDLGYGEVGLFPANSPHGRIDTPHLDKMGKEGIQFTNAYAGYTVCAPSRTTFFTGRHSGQFVKHGWSGTSLPDLSVPTVASLLKKAGYTTGAFGKIAPLVSPLQQGFDAFTGQINQMAAHNMYPVVIKTQEAGQPPVNLSLPLNDKPKNRTLCMQNPSAYNYTTDLFQDEAMAWLDNVATSGTPFFLYIAYTVPHAGGWTNSGKEQGAPVPTDLQYAPHLGDWPDVEVDHAAVISYMDKYVGDVLQKLADHGIDNDTVVFFASDNGAHKEGGHNVSFFDSTGGLKGHKRSLYEGGVRSPTLVRWPGVIAPGQVSDFEWAFWDAMPTFADLAGIPPVQLPSDIDGISIVPTLKGQQQKPHEYLYFTWDQDGGGAPKSGYGVRIGQWKGVVGHCADAEKQQPSRNDQMLLFDLSSDPFEQNNVADAHPTVISNMFDTIIPKNLTCRCYQC